VVLFPFLKEKIPHNNYVAFYNYFNGGE